MTFHDDLLQHLKTGLTTVARCWGIRRTDGQAFGFTDHDCDLVFDDITFRADTGVTAASLEQTTGLSVDNTEALGALSDASLTESDIEAGRFDGAEVICWLVNWADVAQRSILFRGSIGELRRSGGAFHAELRGLTEVLNQPLGRVFQKTCSADDNSSCCQGLSDTAGYFDIRNIEVIEDNRVFTWENMTEYDAGWFQRGRLTVLSGEAIGLAGAIKRDVFDGARRIIELWEPIRAPIGSGVRVRLDAGSDHRFETSRLKFNNAVGFRGFPDIPGDDWFTTYPSSSAINDGGSLRE
ncbi:DUF2163 domain-containing protein [Shimia thalassica]|uniref:DUF2163 domain-containing protein n=1 Tax=Shimia thalassica TaxID=1715693 RepID=UPI0027340944|nr:DUF2163 domain-containing protein [Shimia thalassica]MDP2581283.1 DUF2163 domain-containing protein [Shimia thalassica]